MYEQFVTEETAAQPPKTAISCCIFFAISRLIRHYTQKLNIGSLQAIYRRSLGWNKTIILF